jgi:beta-glucanase (GH16 family)
MRRPTALLLILVLAACSRGDVAFTPQASPAIRVSESPSSSLYIDLHGATLSGGRYIFVPSVHYLERVSWVLDGEGYDTDHAAPWSLNSKDTMFNMARLADGQHTLTARYFYQQGGRQWEESVSATFTVKNAAPESKRTDRRGELVFSEDFNGSSLNTNVWDTCYPWGNGGGRSGLSGRGNCYNASTGEEQLYVDDAISVSDGTLKLTAKRERVTANGKTFDYTSGMIASHPRRGGGFMTQYGYIEARIKVPSGKGFWPAFWTLPWPVAHPPEIDITEVLGDSITTHRMHYHYDDNGRERSVGKNYTGPDLSANFHTYAVDWQPGLIVWYFDGQEVFRTTQSVTAEPMYLLLNLAVDGWAGPPNSSTPWPGVMEVDYVRVYR